jgi:hypothetical protein
MTISIEAPPLDLTDEQAQALLDWQDHIEQEIRSSRAIAIAMDVARNTLLFGQSDTSHGEYERRCGACRRSIDSAVKLLKRQQIIERIGKRPDGRAIYRANLERAHAVA